MCNVSLNPPPHRFALWMKICVFMCGAFSLCHLFFRRRKSFLMSQIIGRREKRKRVYICFMYHHHPFILFGQKRHPTKMVFCAHKAEERNKKHFMLLLFTWPKVKLNKNLFCFYFQGIFDFFFAVTKQEG
jgi:hypothetical protein